MNLMYVGIYIEYQEYQSSDIKNCGASLKANTNEMEEGLHAYGSVGLLVSRSISMRCTAI